MSIPEHLLVGNPDPEASMRFLRVFEERHPSHYRKLIRDDSLLADVVTLSAYSPLLATTLLQTPDYVAWLRRRRKDTGIRGKEELLESLARFALTNSQLDAQVLFARFRRRELLRIYLADIRRQLTVAEVTEELSNLADAVLSYALRLAKQEIDNRYGFPSEIDEKGRQRASDFCIVSLGKLGSAELNYSSDIDLLFIYSEEGETSGGGTRGKVTNREYFGKLAELISKFVGQQGGEGAAYRVDLRLRPHGRVGPLAISVADAVRYYRNDAATWERQVLIRSRASAGRAAVFRRFWAKAEDSVFVAGQSVEQALQSVRDSKAKIDFEHSTNNGFNVKLGHGGIREIEFIAQALQLAYGGTDPWLRVGHTLKSLRRLADRGLLSETEVSQLFDAYEFERRLEHRLQMEQGLQTHLVPGDADRRDLIARRMGLIDASELTGELSIRCDNVRGIFERIFGDGEGPIPTQVLIAIEPVIRQELATVKPSGELAGLTERSPRLGDLLEFSPWIVETLPLLDDPFPPRDYRSLLLNAISAGSDLRGRMLQLRRKWLSEIAAIMVFDVAGKISTPQSKVLQTRLAEASIASALEIARLEMEKRFGTSVTLDGLSVMGLGKLGGAGIDYESDLDLVLVYDENVDILPNITAGEFYARAAEVFINALSSVTLEGSLYRVDLRLRPHGKNGANVISHNGIVKYFKESAAIWEMLAFVKLRASGGNPVLSKRIESDIASVIFERTKTIPATDLANETRRIRDLLEAERTSKRTGEINIKFGAGGMLDIYFAIRFLQLREQIVDEEGRRSSKDTLRGLLELGKLSDGEYAALDEGYDLLSDLDHALRLIAGRSNVIPHDTHPTFTKLVRALPNREQFLRDLNLHRLRIREAFDSITA